MDVVLKASTNSTNNTPKLLIVPGMRILVRQEPKRINQPQPPSGGTRSYSLLSSFFFSRLTAMNNHKRYCIIELWAR